LGRLAPPPAGAPTGHLEAGISLQTDIDGLHGGWKAAGVELDAR
jgi:hypothetical protein